MGYIWIHAHILHEKVLEVGKYLIFTYLPNYLVTKPISKSSLLATSRKQVNNVKLISRSLSPYIY